MNKVRSVFMFIYTVFFFFYSGSRELVLRTWLMKFRNLRLNHKILGLLYMVKGKWSLLLCVHYFTQLLKNRREPITSSYFYNLTNNLRFYYKTICNNNYHSKDKEPWILYQRTILFLFFYFAFFPLAYSYFIDNK